MSGKRAAWERIRAEYPELASALIALRARFGRPAAISVTDTRTGEVLFRTEDDTAHARGATENTPVANLEAYFRRFPKKAL